MTKSWIPLCLALSVVHCSWKVNPNFAPVPDPDEINKKARAEFLQRPIIQQFTAEGFTMDCEGSICGQIPDASLQTLLGFKDEFRKYQDQMGAITLVNEDYPHFDYALRECFLPKELQPSLLQEFFEVLASIREFEQRLGSRVGFPNSRTLKASIYPLLEILNQHFEGLKAQSARFQFLELSSVFNRFSPQHKMLQLRLKDVRQSFSDLWAFMGLLFQAQDNFGKVEFYLKYEDKESRPILEALLNHKSVLAPLLRQLQGRRLLFAKIGCDAYADGHDALWDMMVGSECEVDYFEKVFRDQIEVVKLSRLIGLQIEHYQTVIHLHHHDICLQKVSSVAGKIKEKRNQIKTLMLISAGELEQKVSSFIDGKLKLACDQEAADMDAVISSIP